MNTPRKLIRSSITAAVLAAVALTTIAAPTFAAKPVGGGSTTSTSSLTLVMVTDQNTDGLPNWGDTITWQVSTTATAAPYVDLACYQGATLVGTATAGYFDSYRWPYAKNMTLKSASWTGGAADCTARLYMLTRRGSQTLATAKFHVGA
jgi:hypothetical protein